VSGPSDIGQLRVNGVVGAGQEALLIDTVTVKYIRHDQQFSPFSRFATESK